jgi:hypothetical protein
MKHNSKIIFLLLIITVLISLFLMAFRPLQEVGPSGPTVELTAEFLAAVAGVVLSLAFSYIPGVRTAFAGLMPEVKRLVMLGLLAVVTIILTLLTCNGIVDTGVACDQNGIIRIVWTFILAMIANQTTYQISPQPPDVQAAAYAAKTDEHNVRSWG